MLDVLIWCGLVVTILLVYSQVEHFEFVSYDDPEYVTENASVRAGLTPATVKWTLSAVVAGNWMPITLLSHAADVQFFGLQSGAHHMMSVLLHALAAVLLFAALGRATRARWPSALVALVFALHPLHVESVAWVAERKDVLSAFFGFAVIYSYVRYTELPSLPRYLLVMLALALGLMSKPMLVTLPFLLLLLDFWPLQRACSPKLLWEKLPLLSLSIADSITTFMVQGSSGAVQAIPLAFRLRNALASYATYLGQMVWPSGLAVFYPYHAVPLWQVALASAILLGISAFVVRHWRSHPYLVTGWGWYLGTLIPVIGIVQAGSQAHADRYTYIPMAGISIMLAWGGADILKKWPASRTPLSVFAGFAGVACLVLTARQTSRWQNSGTLYQSAIEVTRDNFVAQNGLGIYLAQTGRGAEAIPHFEEVLRIIPDDAKVHNSLGILLANTAGRRDEAIAHFEAAIRNHPDYMEAQYNLGLALSQVPGRRAEAVAHFQAAERLRGQP